MSEEDKGFEIRDRRKVREEQDPERTAQAAGTSGPEAQQETEPGPKPKGGHDEPGRSAGSTEDEHPMPPVDFLSFAGSLAATAFMYMGEKLSPDQPETFVDLRAARQMIDLLDLLKAKTKGNLDEHEAEGLEAILYNLRMRYLHESGGK